MQKNEILVVHGGSPAEMAKQLAEAAGLAELIGDKNAHIGFKPNLVVPRPADGGATTHPELLAGLMEYLSDHGFSRFSIIEGAWVGASTAKAFDACGYRPLAQRFGAKLVDTQKDGHHPHDCGGMEIDICDAALSVDFMINLPVLKGHCQTLLTCALKNNKGIIPNAEKRRFHTMGLHRPIAHLNLVAKNDFILVDGICGDLDFEEGGNPVYAGRAFAARDPVLCDAFAAAQLGLSPAEVPYIGLAAALGVGSDDLGKAQLRFLNEGDKAPAAQMPGGKVRRLAAHIKEQDACSACYAALVRALSRLDTAALAALPGPVCVGQGFKGRAGDAGVGRCTAAFARTVPGCPPAAGDIVTMLREYAASDK